MKISVELRRAGRAIILESTPAEDALISQITCDARVIHEEKRPLAEGEDVEAQLEALHQEIRAGLLNGDFDKVIMACPADPSGARSGIFSGPPSGSGPTPPPMIRPSVEAEGAEELGPVHEPAIGEPARVCPRCSRRYEQTRQRCPDDGKLLVDDLSGHLIGGRYLIKSLIGVGGMDSTVWKAWQTSTERPVALKLLPNPDQNAAERFARGARIASNLNHPNITTIHDYGVDEEHLFLAMELLEGQSLHGLLRQLPWLKAERALHITEQILRGLQHAHERQIVHRDLKPGNLFLINNNDDPDFVKIVDFGIAKFATNADQEIAERLGQDVTEQRQICGTPRYMAPEQITMGVVDQRTDLYAVGIILYRMLTGRTPFDDADAHGLFRAHLRDEPPRFSEIRPSATIPHSVEAAVFRVLSKDPDERFSSASEMRVALKQISRQEGWIDEHTSASMTIVPDSMLLEAPRAAEKPRGGGAKWAIILAFLALLGAVAFLAFDKLEGDPIQVEEAPQTELKLKSQPPKALVYKAGKLLGETPLTIKLAQQRHPLTLKHPERGDTEIVVDLTDGGRSLTHSVTLAPKPEPQALDAAIEEAPDAAPQDAAPKPKRRTTRKKPKRDRSKPKAQVKDGGGKKTRTREKPKDKPKKPKDKPKIELLDDM